MRRLRDLGEKSSLKDFLAVHHQPCQHQDAADHCQNREGTHKAVTGGGAVGIHRGLGVLRLGIFAFKKTKVRK